MTIHECSCRSKTEHDDRPTGGRHRSGHSPSLRSQLRDIVDQASDLIVVDLEAVPYLDSSGVATLVELLQSCRQKGLDLTLCRLGERVCPYSR